MAKRLLAVIDSTDADGPYRARARVYRDSEWDEFVVRYYHGDELLSYMGAESDSFHNDQADAMGTAEMQVKALAKQGTPGAREDNPESAVAPLGKPIEVRLKKRPGGRVSITVVWGLNNVSTFATALPWKQFLEERGWDKVPRLWD